MHLSQDEIDAFAEWSGDRNPLHVDAHAAQQSYFGRCIAHGILTLTRAFRESAAAFDPPPRGIDVEFRGAVAPGQQFSIDSTAGPEGGSTISLRSADDTLLNVRCGSTTEAAIDTGWLPGVAGAAPARRAEPASREARDFAAGFEIAGAFETGPVPDVCDTHGALASVQVRTLALCSYLVGMEAPGLRSLFTRLTVTFAASLDDAPILLYRLRSVRFDPQFRMLDSHLDVLRPDGTPVAGADIRSYVRFTPLTIEPGRLSARLSASTLKGKVALVTGGTRGLGAELTTALAGAGCHVFASFRSEDAAATALAARLREHGLAAELVKGDASDPAWCDATVRDIVSRHGRLDVLVLNACAPPAPLGVSRTTAAQFDGYISSNLAVAATPLRAAIDALENSQGSIVCISSSFVRDAQPGFGHYVALKQTVETLVRAAVTESGRISALISRPPRLQTAWNDTPTGVLGTISADVAAAHIVNGLASLSPGAVTLGDSFPPFEEPATRVDSAPEHALTIGLAASFTAEPLLPGLHFWLRELGLSGDVDLAPYGQIVQTLLGAWSGARAPGQRINVVALRIRDWLRELDTAQLDGDRVRVHLDGMVADMVRALRSHRARGSADTILLLCPSTSADAPDEYDAALAAAEAMLVRDLQGTSGLQVISARDFHEQYAVRATDVNDPLREHIAHVPYQTAYFHVLATLMMRAVYKRLVPPRKAIVVDCDNTLWRGVIGEVGVEGIQFDRQHRELHDALVSLSSRGVLVCLGSKNDEADVWRAFDARADWGLRREHIVAAAVNWRPKSENIKELAARLNLGLDSFVFLDDNPLECAEVRSGCPEVLTLTWPQDADEAVRLLQHTWELDAGTATAEDKRRTELYKEEFNRQSLLAETLTFRDFIDSLGLEVTITPLAPADHARASQLTLRTNQFNFTTIRRNESELAALLQAGQHDVRTVRVKDRFGDYGLVGLIIGELKDRSYEIDTFLVSCRVLGRGVEHRMAAEAGRMALDRGATDVTIRVPFTKRNTPARAFVETLVPENARRATDAALEAQVTADWLASVRFEPADEAPVPVIDDATPRAAAPVSGGARRRERQIERTARDLGSLSALGRVIESGDTPAPPQAAPAADLDARIVDVFAAALRMPAADVRRVNRLDALGCDSFRIVEITVALTQQFPWLPGTLLFEHRTVSEIVGHIADLAAGQARPTAGSAVSSPARSDSGTASLDIAVVGMDVRCAGAGSPEELWELLSTGGVSVKPVVPDREFFLKPLEDSRAHFAGLLDDVDQFDAEFFGIAPKEAELMDPQLRLFLEIAWGALEDAGAAGAELDPDTGVFAGVMYSDYAHAANLHSAAGTGSYKSWESFSLANRVSQLLGLRGPSLAVDTACSSSATALHLACRALQAGDCRVALVGGVNLILDPARFAQLGRLGILSLTGRCLAFGAEADGTNLGEGAGVVVLRPLADAVARGDRIYGIVKGTGVSTGSGTVGFTAPHPQAQAEAIKRALRSARIDPRTISYVETHGTGTGLGDPIEVRGLSLAYEDTSLFDERIDGSIQVALGSIKPNIGHLEAGAGIVGLIKILLQLQHGQLLPSLTSRDLNPQIPFADLPFFVQRSLGPWAPAACTVDGRPATLPRRAAVSSFGVGGANVHVIVEEGPQPGREPGGEHPPASLITVSARRDVSLAARVQQIQEMLERQPDLDPAQLAVAASVGRRHFEHRIGVPGVNGPQLVRALNTAAAARTSVERASPSKLAFLFTGQGSQYAGMGRELYDAYPVFRDALDECATVLEPLLPGSLLVTMFPGEGADAGLLDQTGYTQPALFSLEYALAALWRSWGVQPELVVGHSVGEIAAMCVAGGLTLQDGLRLIAARGRLMQALPAGGAMASLMTTESRARDAIAGLEESVSIAAINSPGQVVISGQRQQVTAVVDTLKAAGIKSKELTVSHAFHSPLMRPMLAEYAALVNGLAFRVPQIRMVSGVTGTVIGEEITQPAYWLRNVTDPVRFADAARTLRREGVTSFVEIGPQPTLLGLARQSLDEDADACRWIASLRKDTPAAQTVMAAAGALYESGVDLTWRNIAHGTRTSLPRYPFARKRHWITPRGERPELPSVTRPRPAHVPEATGVAERYQLEWEAQPLSAKETRSNDAGAWLVIGGDDRTRALSDELSGRGATVTVIAGSDSQIRAHLRNGASLRGVIYVPDRSASSARTPAHAAALVSRALELTVLLAERPASDDSRLWIVTAGATDGAAPEQAPLWGLGRTIALEHPALWGGLIDLAGESTTDEESTTDTESSMPAVVDELLSGSPDDQIVLQEGNRLVPRLMHGAQATVGAFVVDPDGTYLITGGFGALGRHTAEWLVSKGARHLVLAGRSAGRSADIDVINGLKARGADVRLDTVDVTSEPDVVRLLESIGPSLRGIVHAAGIDQSVALSALDPPQIANVMDPKVRGAWFLHEHSREYPLQFFIAFSSLASVLGATGRAHYAAANAFLDGLALTRQREGRPALTVNWGPWAGGGMATADTLREFERIGSYGLDPATALDRLDDALASGMPTATIAAIDWNTFVPMYEARRRRPMLSRLAPDAPAAPEPQARAPWMAQLTAVPEGRRAEVLVGLLRQEAANTMGVSDPSDIPADRSVYELGMDSLLAAEFAGRLQRQLGIPRSNVVFEHPRLRDLADQLLVQVASVAASAGGALLTEALATEPCVEAAIAVAAGSVDTRRGNERLVSTERVLPASGVQTGITTYQPADAADVFAFCAEAWPHRRQDWVEPRWRWMFEASAARLGQPPQVWLYRDAGRVVGHNGSIPVAVTIAGDQRNTGWLVDTMVLPDYRDRAVGPQLMNAAHDDLPFALSLGQTEQMRGIQLRLGWKQVAPLQTAQLLIRPERVLKGKLPGPAAMAAGWGLRASSALRDMTRSRPDASLREVAEFGAPHSALWEAMATGVTCAVRRDASYLNWKYVAQPGQDFLRLEILRAGELRAVAICMFREPDEHYKYRRAFLVDLVAPLDDEPLLVSSLHAVAERVADRGADALICLHVGARLTAALKRCGFHLREPERHLLVRTEGLDDRQRTAVTAEDSWFVTHGDSDIDRPW